MANEISIERLTIVGFRAYLKEQSFRLRTKKGPTPLAVFAPNAKGKSSLVDANASCNRSILCRGLS